MGIKVKGNCFCPACDSAVAAQKSTHRFRNIATTVLLPASGGLSAAGYANGRWHCPNCGGPVRELRAPRGTSSVRDLIEISDEARENMATLRAWVNSHPVLSIVIPIGTVVLLALFGE